MIEVSGPSASTILSWHLADCERWNYCRGPWIDPDKPEELMRKWEAARHLLWILSKPLVRGNRG